MKRATTALFLASLVGAAYAQTAFTILRPVNESKVREAIRLVFPKDSIPEGGYIGVFVNDKFIEATVPKVEGENRVYVLDSKKAGLPDGPAKITAKLYVDFSERPRIVDESSVEVNITNLPNIPIPAGGFLLRYKLETGRNYVYHLENNVLLGSITEDRIKKGGRASISEVDSESIRLQYSVDNKYADGDLLVRMQALADKGENSVFLTTSSEPEGRRYFWFEMHPVYMRMKNTGMEVFGSVPQYFPVSGSPGPASRTDLYAVYPLPTLPSKRISVGDTWQTRFQVGAIDLDNIGGMTSLTEKIPARGEFLGLEWEGGHPCAKIRHSLSVGNSPASRSGVVSIDETIWFALDKSVVVKMVREQVFETKVQSDQDSNLGAVSGTGGGTGPNTAPTTRARTRGRGGRLGSGGGVNPGTNEQVLPAIGIEQQSRGARGRVRRPPRDGVQSFEEKPQAGTLGARAGGAAAPVVTTIRRTFQQIFVLEN